METMIFLIVLAIIIFSNIASIRKKMNPSGEKKQGGWKQTLKNIMEEIKAEMDKAGGESPPAKRRPSGWDDLVQGRREEPSGPENRHVRPEARKPEAATLMEKREPRRIETKEPPRLERGAETLMETRRKKGDTPEERMSRKEKGAVSRPPAAGYRPEIPVPPPADRRPAKPVYEVGQLRKAVIWSEILSAPVALRRPRS